MFGWKVLQCNSNFLLSVLFEFFCFIVNYPISHTHTHTHFLTHTVSHTHTFSLILSLSLTLLHTFTHFLRNSHTHKLTRAYAYSHALVYNGFFKFWVQARSPALKYWSIVFNYILRYLSCKHFFWWK